MHRFAHRKIYNIYQKKEEQEKLTGVPACWKNRARFINPDITQEYGFAYPLLYDIAGLHTLYHLKNPAINRKIDDVINYLTTDEFHRSIADGYRILVEGNGVYHSMGWGPKYPGWFDAADDLENGNVPKLLFYALYCTNYPAARKTQWFGDLLRSLETYKTEGGRYTFPAGWLAEKKGYAVMGHHLSFGENRRKRNWREIESTFYMQILKYT